MARFDRYRTALTNIAVIAVSALAAPALAEDGGSHPFDSALKMLNLKTDAGSMPDFVTQSRGSQPEENYIPIGAKPPARSLKPKTAAEVKALTADLDAARAARVAGKRPLPAGAADPAKTAKAPGKSAHPQLKDHQATNH